MHTTATPEARRVSVDLPTVLDVAAGYLEQHGWCFGALYSLGDSTEPSACATGALAVAIYGTPVNPMLRKDRQARHVVTASAAVLDWLGIDADTSDPLAVFGRLYDWNDTPGRTPAQVIGTFRAVADEQRRAA